MRVIIVDENDNQIGLKLANEITPVDIYRVSALWLTNQRGQILLAQRKLTKQNDPGKWGPAVSGTLEEGETYETNIKREAEEEIGLTGYSFNIGPKIFNNFGKYRFWVQWFSCQTDWPLQKFKIQADEVEQIDWVDRKQLAEDVAKNPNNYIAGAENVWRSFLI